MSHFFTTEATIKRRPTNSKLRIAFSLKFLLLLFIPAGVGAAWLNHHWKCLQPLEWEDYSDQKLSELLNSGKRVLVFAAPEWSIHSHLMWQDLERPEVQYLIRSRKASTLYFEINNPAWQNDPRLQEFSDRAHLRNGWFIKTCCLVYFDPENPDKTKAIYTFLPDPKNEISDLIR
jgi:hypothetical protein